MVKKGQVLAQLKNLDLEVKIAEKIGLQAQAVQELGSVEQRLATEARLDKTERVRLEAEKLKLRRRT